MISIYSKVKPGLLLHMVYRAIDFSEERLELVPVDNRLQCAALKLKEGKTFKPHRHIKRFQWTRQQTQESWVVMAGSVECSFYDIDGKIILKPVLEQGDVSFSLGGGHTYKILKSGLIYEFKTGPYQGQKKDKRWLK